MTEFTFMSEPPVWAQHEDATPGYTWELWRGSMRWYISNRGAKRMIPFNWEIICVGQPT
jgi:hypothetical protein